MKKTIKDFLFPKKSNWIDISCYDLNGRYFLLQMRSKENNEKEFRNVGMGFINEPSLKEYIFDKVLNIGAK